MCVASKWSTSRAADKGGGGMFNDSAETTEQWNTGDQSLEGNTGRQVQLPFDLKLDVMLCGKKNPENNKWEQQKSRRNRGKMVRSNLCRVSLLSFLVPPLVWWGTLIHHVYVFPFMRSFSYSSPSSVQPFLCFVGTFVPLQLAFLCAALQQRVWGLCQSLRVEL